MGYHIETRKVQQTGGSSYIISLPKEWIVKHGIEKKDTLGIISQPDGNILITPNINSEELEKTKKFVVDEITTYNYMFRLLIGAYLMGYSKIEIISSKKFEPFIRDCITEFTQIAIGPEIIEESNTHILIKDLLNPKEMPFHKTIKRMYILAESMHNDAINALKNNDKELANEVTRRDNDVDRLHWLIGRQSSIVLSDIILSQKMGITLQQANHYQLISRFLERIGDHAVKIAKNALKLMDKEIDPKIIQKMTEASKIALESLNNSYTAWLEENIDLANQNIDAVSNLIKACEDIPLSSDKANIEVSIAIGYIIESIRRTGEYSGDISEIIINIFI